MRHSHDPAGRGVAKGIVPTTLFCMTAALPDPISLMAMVGDPVAENPIDQLFNAVFTQHEVPMYFAKVLLTDPGKLPQVLAGASAMGFAGLGITVPYKEVVIAHLDRIDPDASRIGAVNYVTFEDGESVGHQNDASAVVAAIEERQPVAGASVLLLGAGGAARGVGAGLAAAGVRRLVVAARRPEQGEPVARMLADAGEVPMEYLHWQGDLACPDGVDIVINATSAGAAPQLVALALDWDTFSAGMLALDMVTGPRNTPFIEAAADRGLATIDGVDVLNYIGYYVCKDRGLDVPVSDIARISDGIAGVPRRDR